ncbi:unnamed protein product [Nezara viridula]|uniref:Uncharacterized protein n=1 Tax=Nezara viridula TaxID=85310 RepID=A0A9P0HS15_NEZVI|nr:unnamed protein product [Nezara viridula]
MWDLSYPQPPTLLNLIFSPPLIMMAAVRYSEVLETKWPFRPIRDVGGFIDLDTIKAFPTVYGDLLLVSSEVLHPLL